MRLLVFETLAILIIISMKTPEEALSWKEIKKVPFPLVWQVMEPNFWRKVVSSYFRYFHRAFPLRLWALAR